MADLASFLSDRYAEAEAAARDLLRTAQDVRLALKEPHLLGREIPGWHSWPDVEAMCNSRLADIALKRAILAEHKLVPAGYQGEGILPGEYGCSTCDVHEDGTDPNGVCKTVRLIAAIWSGHPDYQQEWAPQAEFSP